MTSSNEYVILFPRAFDLSNDKFDRVMAHEVSHLLIQGEWSDLATKYKKDVGWPSNESDESIRPGDFVDSDGKQSAEEDFANNIEYFMFEPATLKAKCPAIYAWIEKNLSKSLRLQKGCRNEK